MDPENPMAESPAGEVWVTVPKVPFRSTARSSDWLPELVLEEESMEEFFTSSTRSVAPFLLIRQGIPDGIDESSPRSERGMKRQKWRNPLP